MDPIKALQYLQKHIAEVIDHNDTDQLNSVSISFYFYFVKRCL